MLVSCHFARYCFDLDGLVRSDGGSTSWCAQKWTKSSWKTAKIMPRYFYIYYNEIFYIVRTDGGPSENSVIFGRFKTSWPNQKREAFECVVDGYSVLASARLNLTFDYCTIIFDTVCRWNCSDAKNQRIPPCCVCKPYVFIFQHSYTYIRFYICVNANRIWFITLWNCILMWSRMCSHTYIYCLSQRHSLVVA